MIDYRHKIELRLKFMVNALQAQGKVTLTLSNALSPF